MLTHEMWVDTSKSLEKGTDVFYTSRGGHQVHTKCRKEEKGRKEKGIRSVYIEREEGGLAEESLIKIKGRGTLLKS